MIVGVPRESFPGERRVALAPGVIPNLLKAGLEVVVEAGAGAEAGYPDPEYHTRGAKILPGRAEVFGAADIIVTYLDGVRRTALPMKDSPAARFISGKK